MALESTAPSLEAVFTSEVRAAMAERDERIRAEERARILALLDSVTAPKQTWRRDGAVWRFGFDAALAEVRRQIEVAR